MINLHSLPSPKLAQLHATITSIETTLEDLQDSSLIEGSGIDPIELFQAVAAELEFREALEQAE